MDIIEILGNYGATIPEDQQENFRKDVLKSYKSVVEYNKVVGERDSLRTANSNYETQVTSLNAQLSESQTKATQLSEKVTGYERQEKVSKAGISQEFIGFVTHEVSKQVTDTKDFDSALKEYVNTHQQFKAGTKTIKQSSPSLDGDGGNPKTTNQMMTDAILKGAGKK